MRKILLVSLILILAAPVYLHAQKSGTFVGSFGLGLTAAQGDFADEAAGLSAGSGFGIEAEIRYYVLGGFSVGGFANYVRFGSSYPTSDGRLSFNLSQLGGLAKMNFLNVSKGKLYLMGGAGVFTPNAHFYVPEDTFDRTGNQGNFVFGGIGLSSPTDRNMLYELEIKYNIASSEYNAFGNSFEIGLPSDSWDFIYFGVKLSFASKGKGAPPRY